jgi:predicted protein tyrosine phosphatase
MLRKLLNNLRHLKKESMNVPQKIKSSAHVADIQINPDDERLKRVVFISRRKAESMTPNDAVIISIHDASEGPADLKTGWLDRLNLCFHDTDDADSVLKAFSSEDADKVLAFAERHKDTGPVLYVHCSLGVSRSAGVAMALSELRGLTCYADNLPVSFQNYRVYNKLVYRRIMCQACAPGDSNPANQSAFGEYLP